MDKNGDILTPFDFAVKTSRMGDRYFDLNFSDGVAPLQNIRTGKTSYVDQTGKIILTLDQKQLREDEDPGAFYYFHSFSEGMCRIESGRKWASLTKPEE